MGLAAALRISDRVYQRVAGVWENPRTQRSIATLLAALFLGTLLAVELRRRGMLPASIPAPHQHFQAVGLVFSCLLFFEAVALVFSLAASTADSVGKQLEIFAIILLRHSFQEFTEVGGPLGTAQFPGLLGRVLADAAGSLLIFVLAGYYYRLQRHRQLTADLDDRRAFISGKKALALVLLAAFWCLGVRDLWAVLHGGPWEFFDSFFTLLVFSDILLMLLSLRSSSVFRFVFRNSGFALVTVVLRLAFAAPPLYNAALGIGAALYAVGLTLAFNSFGPQGEPPEPAGTLAAPAPPST